MNTIHIKVLLLVEDDDDDVVLTERKIGRARLPVDEVVVARTVADAKRILQTREIDLILLDLNMGETRGLDTLREIRPLYRGVIIVLTSLADEQTGIDAIRQGADDYLVKNRLTEENLRSSVAYAITRHGMRATAANAQRKLDQLADMMPR